MKYIIYYWKKCSRVTVFPTIKNNSIDVIDNAGIQMQLILNLHSLNSAT